MQDPEEIQLQPHEHATQALTQKNQGVQVHPGQEEPHITKEVRVHP